MRRKSHGGAADQDDDEEGEKKKISSAKCLLKIQFPDDGPLEFKVKFTTPFQRVYDAIAEARNINSRSFRLVHDGTLLKHSAVRSVIANPVFGPYSSYLSRRLKCW